MYKARTILNTIVFPIGTMNNLLKYVLLLLLKYDCLTLQISQVRTVHSMILKNTSSNQTTITNAKASVHSITVRVPYMSVSIISYWQ